MGIPNISRESNSSGRVSSSSPPLSSATDPYVGGCSPLRTLAEPLRKSMGKAKQDDNPAFLFLLRPLSVTPVTPPRRPLYGKPATEGSVDVPCIGRTRIGTRKSFSSSLNPVLTASQSCSSADNDERQHDANKGYYPRNGAFKPLVLQGIRQ